MDQIFHAGLQDIGQTLSFEPEGFLDNLSDNFRVWPNLNLHFYWLVIRIFLNLIRIFLTLNTKLIESYESKKTVE